MGHLRDRGANLKTKKQTKNEAIIRKQKGLPATLSPEESKEAFKTEIAKRESEKPKQTTRPMTEPEILSSRLQDKQIFLAQIKAQQKQALIPKQEEAFKKVPEEQVKPTQEKASVKGFLEQIDVKGAGERAKDLFEPGSFKQAFQKPHKTFVRSFVGAGISFRKIVPL